MDATPLLGRLVTALAEHKLEVVLIGNAAAAMQGAPVTTVDFDFMFRDTPTNLRKLKGVAKSLDAVILRSFYPVSKLYRMVDDASGLQADFMPVIHGVRSFEELRSRAVQCVIGTIAVKVASLADIIASKKAAGRDRDLAVLPVLEQTLRATRSPPRRRGS
jgi:predicted nucleotidyltransferase